jgi:hypothetical protein
LAGEHPGMTTLVASSGKAQNMNRWCKNKGRLLRK